MKGLGQWLKWFFGGGDRKYRVFQNDKGKFEVEMKGGGCVPFWGFGCFSDFDSWVEAEKWAIRWAAGGSVDKPVPAVLGPPELFHLADMLSCFADTNKTVCEDNIMVSAQERERCAEKVKLASLASGNLRALARCMQAGQ